MPARLRIEQLSAAQRSALGVSGARGKSRGNRGTSAGRMNCHDCGEPLDGQRAIERHRDKTGHRRFDLPLGTS